jgi:hypothetical protein
MNISNFGKNTKKVGALAICLMGASIFGLPHDTSAVDSIKGLSDSQLVSLCKEGCRNIYPVGSSDYSSCVYCCTHNC